MHLYNCISFLILVQSAGGVAVVRSVTTHRQPQRRFLSPAFLLLLLLVPFLSFLVSFPFFIRPISLSLSLSLSYLFFLSLSAFILCNDVGRVSAYRPARIIQRMPPARWMLRHHPASSSDAPCDAHTRPSLRKTHQTGRFSICFPTRVAPSTVQFHQEANEESKQEAKSN